MSKPGIRLAVSFILLFAPALLLAQNETSKPAPSDSAATPTQYYRLDFVLRELDGTKVVNQRSYQMTVAAIDSNIWQLRSGTRIPIGDRDPHYIDVGTNFDVRAKTATGGLSLNIGAEISSVGVDTTLAPGSPPPLRQVRAQVATLAPLGKPTVVFTADDPASKHRFELEVMPSTEK